MVDTENNNEIRSYLGLCTYYRWFISDYAKIGKPVTKLKEKQAFQWMPEAESAF
jgi:hypothetical protein